jgi:ElaB/YqjD/DUF883 family membrane-anchored ribosome-binding protein
MHSEVGLKVTFEGDDAMLATRNSAFSQKKDLHVGGLGANAQARFATLADPKGFDAFGTSRPFLKKVREAVENANYVLRDNPLAALGLAAGLGLAVGYLLSRRS